MAEAVRAEEGLAQPGLMSRDKLAAAEAAGVEAAKANSRKTLEGRGAVALAVGPNYTQYMIL